jgi:hypothetical protein
MRYGNIYIGYGNRDYIRDNVSNIPCPLRISKESTKIATTYKSKVSPVPK